MGHFGTSLSKETQVALPQPAVFTCQRTVEGAKASTLTGGVALFARKRAPPAGRPLEFPWEIADSPSGKWKDCRKSRCAPEKHMRTTPCMFLRHIGCKARTGRGLRMGGLLVGRVIGGLRPHYELLPREAGYLA